MRKDPPPGLDAPSGGSPGAGGHGGASGHASPGGSPDDADADFDALKADLLRLFARGVEAPLDDEAFGRLALRVFRWQLEANPVYRRFCEGRGAGPDASDWRSVPAVPTSAFKHLALVAAPPGRAVEAVYRTSGTSRGRERRGAHHVVDLDLYRAAALPNFAAHLLPDGVGRIPLVCLLPAPGAAPDSSLSAMAGFVAERWGAGRAAWLVDPDGGLDADAAGKALAEAAATGGPVLVLGTAFAFVHLMDTGVGPVRLPDGSRVMETGGFKGRSRTVSREELYAGIEDRLGVPARRVVNEYGMTELLSQFYEPVLRAGGAMRDVPPPERWHVPPPWVRTRVLDPRTLEPLARGEPGLLCHLDLANAGSVACVLTEDTGVAVEGGFRVLGRAVGAEPRGCSLAMEELMEAAGGG